MGARSFVVVGGGIVGLALARQLLEAYPGSVTTVVEKEDRVAAHQSGHNSGVVHAGVYYGPGSLKARLCSRGRAQLREACQEWGVAYEEAGKLIVARDDAELAALHNLHDRATANGVPGLRRLGPDGIREIEPNVKGVAALHSPQTAIVDFARVAEAIADDVRRRGGQVLLGAEVTAFRRTNNSVDVVTTKDVLRAGQVVICAGLQGDRVARLAGDTADPAIVPFRGEYYRLAPHCRQAVKGLVYPVPDPRYPFLGVHFTRRIDGNVDIGPNAVLALAREGYRRSQVEPSDLWATLSWPGTRRMARRHWRAGAREMRTSLFKSAFLAAARAYVPDLSSQDLLPAPAGVRAQAVAADGSLVDDFQVHNLGRLIAVRNAPSPAATSSLAIAEHLVQMMDGALS
ncbi:MAG TPA: L-2-hydroxyglutarate oxidase [Acidimicrobiales bacterium]|nr:L-2-hydroxyglutarate oxidase [Acidimicrobiales bacterium]